MWKVSVWSELTPCDRHNSAAAQLFGDPLPFDNVLDLPFGLTEGEVTIDLPGRKPVNALVNHSGVGDVGSVLVIQDITRIKELESQAEMNRRLAAMGELVANDRESYQYLAESIRMHPDQETLKGMMEGVGFERCDYHNLTGGIVALHRGYKF